MFPENTVFLMTPGGPFSGANYWLQAAIEELQRQGKNVVGIRNGFQELREVGPKTFRDFQQRPITAEEMDGGSVLGSSKIEISGADQKKIEQNLRALGIKNVILSGGDGSFKKGTPLFESLGIKFIHIAKTHDGDFHGFDSLGFDTYCSEGTRRLRDLKTDAKTCGRLNVCVTFGPKSGHTAVKIGMDADADGIMISEVETDFHLMAVNLVKRIAANAGIEKLANPHGVLLVSDSYLRKNQTTCENIIGQLKSEFSKLKNEIASGSRNELNEDEVDVLNALAEGTAEIKNTSHIGYGDRVAPPTQSEKKSAADIGKKAAQLLLEGTTAVAVVKQSGKITTVDVETCRARSISVLDHPELGDIARKNISRFGATAQQLKAAA